MRPLGAVIFCKKQGQALCVACDCLFADSLPLGLGRYPFPDFFRIDDSDLLAGFSQNGDDLSFKRLTSCKPVHLWGCRPIFDSASKSRRCTKPSVLPLREDGTRQDSSGSFYGRRG